MPHHPPRWIFLEETGHRIRRSRNPPNFSRFIMVGRADTRHPPLLLKKPKVNRSTMRASPSRLRQTSPVKHASYCGRSFWSFFLAVRFRLSRCSLVGLKCPAIVYSFVGLKCPAIVTRL